MINKLFCIRQERTLVVEITNHRKPGGQNIFNMSNNIITNLLKKVSQFGKRATDKNQWKPVTGEKYYFAEFVLFIPTEEVQCDWDSDNFDFPIFRTVDECQVYCNKLNKAISQVEP